MSDRVSNPNLIYRELLALIKIAHSHSAAAAKARRLARRAFYRSAVQLRRLRIAHGAWLNEQLQSKGGFRAVVNDWFAPLAFFGEDWHELLRDVDNGATEADYLNSSAGSFTRRQQVARLVKQRSQPLPQPADDMPLEERNALLTKNVARLQSELASAHRLVAQQQRHIARLEAIVNRIERLVKAKASA